MERVKEMEKINLGSIKEIINEREVMLQYYLINEDEDLYGIEVTLKDDKKEENKYTGPISKCEKKVKKLAELLMKCAVTPYVLLEVVDDVYEQEIANEIMV